MRLAIAACLLAFSATAAVAELEPLNTGGMKDWTFNGHVLSEPGSSVGGARVLYCPSEEDDPVLRAAIAAELGGGATVDYFDSRAAVPSLSLLVGYDCVFTWANFAFLDNVATGDALADFVDAGGSVVLGSFCTFTSGNSLSGRIMTDSYAPVWSPTGSNRFADDSYAGDGTTCIHDGVVAYNSTFRDVLALQGGGAQDGSFFDGEIAHAYRADYAVVYSNGAGGVQLAPGGDYPRAIANACSCVASTPTEEKSWSEVKSLYR
jgi:hypothetical protein